MISAGTIISTPCCRPAAVSFETPGLAFPKPLGAAVFRQPLIVFVSTDINRFLSGFAFSITLDVFKTLRAILNLAPRTVRRQFPSLGGVHIERVLASLQQLESGINLLYRAGGLRRQDIFYRRHLCDQFFRIFLADLIGRSVAERTRIAAA